MKAQILTKKFFKCPACGDHELQVDYLKNSTNSGWTWQCKSCVSNISFKLTDDGEIEITNIKSPPKGKENLLILLKPVFQDPKAKDQVYLILEKPNTLHETDIDELQRQQRYYYNEHTCPSNYLGGATVLEGTDDDPHGIFQFVEAIYRPEDFDSNYLHNSGGSYADLFKSLESTTFEKVPTVVDSILAILNCDMFYDDEQMLTHIEGCKFSIGAQIPSRYLLDASIEQWVVVEDEKAVQLLYFVKGASDWRFLDSLVFLGTTFKDLVKADDSSTVLLALETETGDNEVVLVGTYNGASPGIRRMTTVTSPKPGQIDFPCSMWFDDSKNQFSDVLHFGLAVPGKAYFYSFSTSTYNCELIEELKLMEI